MTLLVILALMQGPPERVVIAARPPERPGFFERIGRAAREAGRRLFEKEHPSVAEGNALAAQGRYDEALQRYGEATAAEGSTAQGALQLDRATTLLQLGAERAPDALREAQAARQQVAPHLRSQASYAQALALEGLGKPEQAIQAYADALREDPSDRDAKVNLELLLRTEERPRQEKSAGQPQPDKKPAQQGKDPDQPQQQEGPTPQKSADKQAEDEGKEKQQAPSEQQPSSGEPGQRKEPDQRQAQAKEPRQVDRSEAERLLDALRANEKNLQAWRFAKDKRKEARRGDAAKDW